MNARKPYNYPYMPQPGMPPTGQPPYGDQMPVMPPVTPPATRPVTPPVTTPTMPPTTTLPPGVVPPTQPPVIYPPTGRPLPTGTGTIPPGVPYDQGPPSTRDVGYIQSYLAKNIGRYVKIDFLLGTNLLQDREGTIIEVGTNYVVLQEPQTDDLLMCDLYSIKFVRVYY